MNWVFLGWLSIYPHSVQGGLCWQDIAKSSDLHVCQFHIYIFPLSLFLLLLGSCNSHEEVLFSSNFFLEMAASLWPLLFFQTRAEFISHQGVKSSGPLVLKGSTCCWVLEDWCFTTKSNKIRFRIQTNQCSASNLSLLFVSCIWFVINSWVNIETCLNTDNEINNERPTIPNRLTVWCQLELFAFQRWFPHSLTLSKICMWQWCSGPKCGLVRALQSYDSVEVIFRMDLLHKWFGWNLHCEIRVVVAILSNVIQEKKKEPISIKSPFLFLIVSCHLMLA